jgi:P63C domain-containing protein
MADDTKKEAGRQGGLARKDALSPDARKAIAEKAALARWGAKATHRGNFKDQFGIDVDCYVLDDVQKTAVISQRGMGAALGMGISGSRLPMFVNSKRMSSYVGQELREKLENPLVFQAAGRGQNFEKFPPQAKVNGYDVTILIDVCKAVVSAEAAGQKVNPSVVRQAHVILSASAKAGIKGLVYALAGYDPTREQVIEAFKYYVREEAREYEKEFPDLLYQEWYRLYQLPKLEGSQRPFKFKHLTVEHVWHPLARSSGKVYQLTQTRRAENKADRWKKLHQFLSEIGVKTLRTHLGQVLGIARISRTKDEYEAHINQVFGDQPDLPGIN